ncbi:hypothetical protein M885DRAFT_102632 [Pelagophyceae sp. CCMP2097]|nr:hypothetical protein M885DRAFT_102632 [Pelagophyceae sp. CCMP2097]
MSEAKRIMVACATHDAEQQARLIFRQSRPVDDSVKHADVPSLEMLRTEVQREVGVDLAAEKRFSCVRAVIGRPSLDGGTVTFSDNWARKYRARRLQYSLDLWPQPPLAPDLVPPAWMNSGKPSLADPDGAAGDARALGALVAGFDPTKGEKGGHFKPNAVLQMGGRAFLHGRLSTEADARARIERGQSDGLQRTESMAQAIVALRSDVKTDDESRDVVLVPAGKLTGTAKFTWRSDMLPKPRLGVTVEGEFNGYQPLRLQPSRSKYDEYEYVLELPPGTYAYRYRVDDEVRLDKRAPQKNVGSQRCNVIRVLAYHRFEGEARPARHAALTVDLGGHALGDDGVWALAAAMGRGGGGSLTELCLPSNGISFDGCAALMAAIASGATPQLRRLDVSKNKIGAEGGRAITQHLLSAVHEVEEDTKVRRPTFVVSTARDELSGAQKTEQKASEEAAAAGAARGAEPVAVRPRRRRRVPHRGGLGRARHARTTGPQRKQHRRARLRGPGKGSTWERRLGAPLSRGEPRRLPRRGSPRARRQTLRRFAVARAREQPLDRRRRGQAPRRGFGGRERGSLVAPRSRGAAGAHGALPRHFAIARRGRCRVGRRRRHRAAGQRPEARPGQERARRGARASGPRRVRRHARQKRRRRLRARLGARARWGADVAGPISVRHVGLWRFGAGAGFARRLGPVASGCAATPGQLVTLAKMGGSRFVRQADAPGHHRRRPNLQPGRRHDPIFNPDDDDPVFEIARDGGPAQPRAHDCNVARAEQTRRRARRERARRAGTRLARLAVPRRGFGLVARQRLRIGGLDGLDGLGEARVCAAGEEKIQAADRAAGAGGGQGDWAFGGRVDKWMAGAGGPRRGQGCTRRGGGARRRGVAAALGGGRRRRRLRGGGRRDVARPAPAPGRAQTPRGRRRRAPGSRRFGQKGRGGGAEAQGGHAGRGARDARRRRRRRKRLDARDGPARDKGRRADAAQLRRVAGRGGGAAWESHAGGGRKDRFGPRPRRGSGRRKARASARRRGRPGGGAFTSSLYARRRRRLWRHRRLRAARAALAPRVETHVEKGVARDDGQDRRQLVGRDRLSRVVFVVLYRWPEGDPKREATARVLSRRRGRRCRVKRGRSQAARSRGARGRAGLGARCLPVALPDSGELRLRRLRSRSFGRRCGGEALRRRDGHERDFSACHLAEKGGGKLPPRPNARPRQSERGSAGARQGRPVHVNRGGERRGECRRGLLAVPGAARLPPGSAAFHRLANIRHPGLAPRPTHRSFDAPRIRSLLRRRRPRQRRVRWGRGRVAPDFDAAARGASLGPRRGAVCSHGGRGSRGGAARRLAARTLRRRR